jgi:DNA-binding XRE family transcriptional regulator
MAITFEALLSAEMAADPEFAAEWNRLELARTVAIALIVYRHKHQLSQGELAEHMAVRPARVAELESGETNPKIETLAKIVAPRGLSSRSTLRLPSRNRSSCARRLGTGQRTLTRAHRCGLASLDLDRTPKQPDGP